MSTPMATSLLLHGAASSWYWHLVDPLLAAAGHNTVGLGLDPADLDNPDVVYGHDIPSSVWAEAGRRLRDQSGRPFDDPCPISAWPTIPCHVLAARDDRLFPLEFQRRNAKDRLGLDVEVVPGGHPPALRQPQAVADALLPVAP